MRTTLVGLLLLVACDGKNAADARLLAENTKLKSDNAELMAENNKLQHAAHVAAQGPQDSGAEDEAFTVPNGPLDLAQTAYLHGEYQLAMDLARKIPASGRTWRIIGASACYLKDPAIAMDARKHLDKNNEKFVTSVCQRNGIKMQ